MKTIFSKLFALIMIFIGALLVSCNNQDLTLDNSKISSRSIKNSLLADAGYDEDEFCNLAGEIHNEIVDKVISKLDSDGYRVLEYSDEDSYAIIRDYVFDYVKLTDKSVYPWSDISKEEFEELFKSLNGEIPYDLYIKTFYNLSEETTHILGQIEMIFFYEDAKIVDALKELYCKCDNIKDEDERILIKCAISVGISSYTYWSNSGIEPFYMASKYTLSEYNNGSKLFIDKPCSISWGRIAKSDFTGAVCGGIGGLIRKFILVSLLGPISWSAILGEVVLDAAIFSIEALIGELIDNTLLAVDPFYPKLEEYDNLYHIYLRSKYMSNPDMFPYYLDGRFANLTKYLMY